MPYLLSLLFIAFVFFGCGQNATNDPLAGEVTSIAVEANQSSMYGVGHIQMSAKAFFTLEVPEHNVTETVIWSSSNTTIATVNYEGVVTGGSAGGSVAITGSYEQFSDTATVDVVALTAIEIVAPETNLTQEQTLQLHAVGTFEDGAEFNVTDNVVWIFTSDYEETNATLEQNGTLYTGDANGTLEVNASRYDVNDSIRLYVAP